MSAASVSHARRPALDRDAAAALDAFIAREGGRWRDKLDARTWRGCMNFNELQRARLAIAGRPYVPQLSLAL